MSSPRRPSQPWSQENKPMLERQSTVPAQMAPPRREPLVVGGELLSRARRNKRNSVANAITVTGVREALLVGQLSV